jgi:hypothetical protein
MLNQRLWLSIGTTSVVLLSGATVRATPVEMGVFKSVDAPDARCPVRVVMTGMSDANGFTPVLTNKDVLTGAAVWTWAGSDEWGVTSSQKSGEDTCN